MKTKGSEVPRGALVLVMVSDTVTRVLIKVSSRLYRLLASIEAKTAWDYEQTYTSISVPIDRERVYYELPLDQEMIVLLSPKGGD